MTTHLMAMIAYRGANALMATWILSATLIYFLRTFKRRKAPRIVRLFYRALRPVYPVLIFISIGGSAIAVREAPIWNALYAGQCAYGWWIFRHEDDDDDWWKKLREKATSKVKSLGHRLVLVPAEEGS